MPEKVVDAPEPEEAQLVFADLYDGDYIMSDLMKKSPELLRSLLVLFHATKPKPKPPTSRQVSFQGEGGAQSLQRPAKQPPTMTTDQLSEVIVIVRNGRVEGFTGK